MAEVAVHVVLRKQAPNFHSAKSPGIPAFRSDWRDFLTQIPRVSELGEWREASYPDPDEKTGVEEQGILVAVMRDWIVVIRDPTVAKWE